MLTRRSLLQTASAAGVVLGAPGVLRAQAKKTLRMGHIFPATHPYHKGMERFKSELATRTNNTINVEIYTSSQLGGEIDMLEGLRLGTVDGCACAFSHVATTDNFRKLYLLDMPFLFKDYAAVEAFLAGELEQELFGDLPAKAGLRIVAHGTAGFHQLINSKRAINLPADLRGLKMRVWQSNSAKLGLELMGMTATPMAYSEVFTALQQGVIDGLSNSLTTFHQTKVHEVAKFVSMTNHMYPLIPIIMSDKTYQKLGKDEQKAIDESGKAAGKYWRELYVSDDAKHLGLLKAEGCKDNVANAQAFRAHVEPNYFRFIDLVNQPNAKPLMEKLKKAGGY